MMEFVTVRELLQEAAHKQYAVGAFNVSNMENIQSVLEAAEELQSPYLGVRNFSFAVKLKFDTPENP